MPSTGHVAERTSSSVPASAELSPNRKILVLGICCLSLMLVGMDVTIVNVALPAIQHNFTAAISQLQWIVDAYTLVVASLLMLAGSLADRFGRRRVFQIGLSVFTLASLLCSFAPDARTLIAFRALQGVGAAMLNPVAMSIVTNTFTQKQERARAIGVWGAVFGIALGVGPVLGGALTQALGWRSVFLINVPVGIVAFVLAAVFIPESKAARARAIDPVGQALVIAALGSLIYALIEGAQAGWTSPLILSLFAVIGAAVLALVAYEPRIREPLLEFGFFRSVPFASATVIAVAAFGAFAGLLFLNALYLQQERGFSALVSGLCTLPIATMSLICGPVSGAMIGRFGPRPSLLIAGASMLASALILTTLHEHSPIPLVLAGYALFGVGIGMVNPPISNLAVSGMPLSRSGVAAAIASTSRQAGASIGVAITGIVVKSGEMRGASFAAATHPVWWGVAGCGVAILVMGWAINTRWALKSAERVECEVGNGEKRQRQTVSHGAGQAPP